MIEWLFTSAHFLLSEWIWSVTWGVYIIPFSIAILFFLLKWVEQFNAIRSLLITLAAHLFSILIFAGFVIGILIFIVRLEYVPPQEGYYQEGCNSLNVTLYVGLIYAFLQALFFLLIHRRFGLHLLRVIALVLVSNSLAALMVYLLLPKML